MWDPGEVVWVRDGVEGKGWNLGDAVKRLERHRQGSERYGNKFKFAAMVEKIEMLCEGISCLLFQQLVGGVIEGVGYGWVQIFIVALPGGPARKAFLFSYFFSSSEFGCIYIDVQGHSFTYTACILSYSIVYIYYNVV